MLMLLLLLRVQLVPLLLLRANIRYIFSFTPPAGPSMQVVPKKLQTLCFEFASGIETHFRDICSPVKKQLRHEIPAEKQIAHVTKTGFP